MLGAVILPEVSVANPVIGSAPPCNSWRPAHDGWARSSYSISVWLDLPSEAKQDIEPEESDALSGTAI